MKKANKKMIFFFITSNLSVVKYFDAKLKKYCCPVNYWVVCMNFYFLGQPILPLGKGGLSLRHRCDS